MALTCNIDERGRALRLGAGFILVLAAMASAAGGHPWSALGLLALGAFTLFEGLKGWCAVKAVYPKLPI